MLNLPFQIFYLALRYLTEEENSSQCLKILTQITTEDKNELAEIRGFRPKKITSKSFDNDNKLTLKSFFAFCSVFFFARTNGGKMETTYVQFPKYSRAKRAKT